GVVHRIQQAPERRAVEPRRLVPVALHVEDGLRPDAGERAGREKRDGLVHALYERGLRPELPQLARDADRQQKIEEQPVEASRADRRDEVEVLVTGRPALGRGREHAVLDDRRHGIPLAPLRAVERQTKAFPGDEEDARLHAPAASSTRSAQCSTEWWRSTCSRSARPAPPP